jgi:hypothetical protein
VGKDTNKILICEVCGKSITEKDPFKLIEGYRHRKGCGPGSKAWTDKFGNSDINRLLTKKTKPVVIREKFDPIRRAIKEFCGREKYLRYMDTANKNIECDWTISAMINGKKITHSRAQGCIDPDLLYQQLTKGGKQNGKQNDTYY